MSMTSPVQIKLRAYHILPAEYGTLQRPSHLIGGYACVEGVERNDVRSLGIEWLSIDLEMPLVPRGDAPLLDFIPRVWCLDQFDCPETTARRKTRTEVRIRQGEGDSYVIQTWRP